MQKHLLCALIFIILLPARIVLAQDSKSVAGINLIGRQSIEAHLTFLASDALEGREAGKRGGRVAAEYIKSVLLAAGVKPLSGSSYFQEFAAFSPAREKHADFQVHPDSIEIYKRQPACRKMNLQNVIGLVEGRRADEYVVIGAHYDHLGTDEFLVGDNIYNGADDNASGVAVLLDIAKVIASEEKPERSIIIAFWDGEETNYLGSEYFVQTFTEISRIKANINLDMIARDGIMPILHPEFSVPESTEENTAKGNQFHLLYTEELSNTGHELQSEITRQRLRITPRPAVISSKSRGSDYMPFSTRNIPVLWFFTGLHPDYHTPSDEAKYLDFDKLTEIAKITFIALKNLTDK
jgi:hypothetical protein